jgi:phosphopantetheinyl transferase|tara:strand:- start:843 stop:1337 length:495 start_codon:yes stop_codon:yes gene_type:complete
MRRCLADCLDVAPQAVPLTAPPGSPPKLPSGWGWISLSHCRDALAIAWSIRPVGVDLERLDRRFAAAALAARFFTPGDCQELQSLQGESLRLAVLNQWVAKEAAVKWQRGSLAKDLGRWSCTAHARAAHHSGSNNSVSINRFGLDSWLLAVAGGHGQIGPVCLG